MVYRPFGGTGEKISAIGLGGYHIGNPDQQLGIRIMREALDRGLSFFDNCWSYHDGESERRMGLALKDGYRNKAFLMTKLDGRTKEAAARQIEESLQRFQTDRIDLIQYHENIRMVDPDLFFKGPLDAVLEAQKAGKVRFIGFTGHKDPAIHLKMLKVADKQGFHFNACQMPINIMDAHFRSFTNIIPELKKRNIAVIGMKPIGGGSGNILKSGLATAQECLHYALSLPIATIVTGIEDIERLNQAFEVIETMGSFTKEQKVALLAKTKSAAMTGTYEPFKTTTRMDGIINNPQWMS